MHALEIDYIGHALRLKPLKQGTLLITCYPAVYDQRSPRKIFGKRIETYTSDTLSKRHCVAVYLPSVAYSRGGEDVRWKEREKKKGEKESRDRYMGGGGWSIRSVADTRAPSCSYGSSCRAMSFWPRDRLRIVLFLFLIRLYSYFGKKGTRIWFFFFLFLNQKSNKKISFLNS